MTRTEDRPTACPPSHGYGCSPDLHPTHPGEHRRQAEVNDRRRAWVDMTHPAALTLLGMPPLVPVVVATGVLTEVCGECGHRVVMVAPPTTDGGPDLTSAAMADHGCPESAEMDGQDRAHAAWDATAVTR